MKKIVCAAALIMLTAAANAQILTPVKWSYAAKKIGKREAVIFLKATIDNGWHLYSQAVKDGGPVKTSFTFMPSPKYMLAGRVMEPVPVTRFEKSFNMTVGYFEHSVIFQQKVALKGNAPVEVKGKLEYMVCNDTQCLPPDDVDFSVIIR